MISVDEDEGDVYVHIPSIDASSYALGYSFRAPLPIPEGLFGEAEKADEDSPAEEDENKQESEEAEGTEMVISTSVGGKLLQLEREVDDPNTGDTYIVFPPQEDIESLLTADTGPITARPDRNRHQRWCRRSPRLWRCCQRKRDLQEASLLTPQQFGGHREGVSIAGPEAGNGRCKVLPTGPWDEAVQRQFEHNLCAVDFRDPACNWSTSDQTH
jgi:hypothetical protein